MSKKISITVTNLMFLALFMIPRQFGLSTGSCNMKTCKVYASKLWFFHSIAYGLSFSVAYPFAINKILSSMKATSEGKVFVLIDIANYFATYLFCVTIYLRVLSSSNQLIAYNNSCIDIFRECKKLYKGPRETKFFLLFTTRILYLYLGNTILNAITLYQHSDELSDVSFFYKNLFLIPDLIMATTMIRFRSGIAMYVVCCKQINRAFSECLNLVQMSDGKSYDEQKKIFLQAKNTFEKISEVHSKLFNIIREAETLTGNILIFSILKAFAHLSSTVNLRFQIKSGIYYTLIQFIFSSF